MNLIAFNDKHFASLFYKNELLWIHITFLILCIFDVFINLDNANIATKHVKYSIVQSADSIYHDIRIKYDI